MPGFAPAPAEPACSHCALRLEAVFESCFADEFRTVLRGGASEPIYLPMAAGFPPESTALATSLAGRALGDLRRTSPAHNMLCYREDFFASALHETAHWCIAGAERRRRVDFGYWYAPDGRDAAAQQRFETVECKPQALEWLFSRACDFPFRLSVDNLDAAGGALPDLQPFAVRVFQQARHWRRAGLPPRAARFFTALSREFGTCPDVARVALNPEDLL